MSEAWDEDAEYDPASPDPVRPEDRAVAAADHDRRLEADQRLVALLARDGFEGPRYDRFARDLCDYALPVLKGWLYSGEIFGLCAKVRIFLHPTERELARLHHDADAREELAAMTVAVALRKFRNIALVGGGWTADGGACLTTYFMGACKLVFAGELRRVRDQDRRWRQQDACDVRPELAADDPAAIAVGTDLVRYHLDRVDERTAVCVALHIDGYTHEQIAKSLGDGTSPRAVEGVPHRWRTKVKRELEDGGEPDG
ncbi:MULTISPECIES: RNA polymerase sigma factor [Catenuloplanes]|uniref:Uncharacterized protein n=1 Tax=Catenuloplanes niger TaxID=587534 RepID=A0AAE4CW75_9ACTN|nr:hypothetical protein [Catenuloplanes niger]MDR7328241.1 hypothetical protein [Catenuloplanes niger]